jgi:thiol:disulfide interchange protein DsbA
MFKRQFLRLLGTLCAAGAFTFAFPAQAQPVAGKDYLLVKPVQPTDAAAGKVEVLEFFFYGCPHCDNLQPALKEWLKRKPDHVDFKRMPAVFQDSWVPLTRTYYALEALGQIDKLHMEVFNALHRQKVPLRDAKSIIEWIGGKGVDRKTFAEAYNSFGVTGRLQRSIALTKAYDIPGTPAIAIDGQYLTAPSMTLRQDRSIDYGRFFKVVDELIAKAKAAKGSK